MAAGGVLQLTRELLETTSLDNASRFVSKRGSPKGHRVLLVYGHELGHASYKTAIGTDRHKLSPLSAL
jgi:hypothetical protein